MHPYSSSVLLLHGTLYKSFYDPISLSINLNVLAAVWVWLKSKLNIWCENIHNTFFKYIEYMVCCSTLPNEGAKRGKYSRNHRSNCPVVENKCIMRKAHYGIGTLKKFPNILKIKLQPVVMIEAPILSRLPHSNKYKIPCVFPVLLPFSLWFFLSTKNILICKLPPPPPIAILTFPSEP